MRLLPRLPHKTEDERSGSMTLVEHLSELRARIVYVLYAVLAGSVVAWFLYEPFKNFAFKPWCDWVQQQPPENYPLGCNLIVSSFLEGMLVKIKVVVFLGLALAIPVVLWQLWQFIVPGLTARERRYAIPFIVASTLLFFLGAAFAYVTLPKALQFLLGFAGEGIVPLISFSSYLGFIVLVMLAFGVSFLFPVFLIFLELAGVLSTDRLREWRRYALLGIAIFAAVITPSADPYTMLAMMIPMYLFYEAAIIIGRLLKR